MARGLIEIAKLTVDLTPSPIEPSWILEGRPEASSCILSQSIDGLATTIVWQCTEGKFDWYYDFDETVLILDGSIVLESDGMPPKRYEAGDVIFFKDGAHAKWHVEGHVKKLAFCRKTSPLWFGIALRVFLKLKKIFLPASQRQPASLMAG
ncbi:MAG TPA: cupin domain-containing protein [Bradyrhizobium sp.]|uniref:cupin domain-containing protein n=1 Tax=Bradyrhizobium sp. TaxID=376 RepID=UPI002BE0137D|nr:cupin domain-containing protein [Bradyrhizobium sp.]HLZ04827.1 cupin domain-containing protein [Bradyrhizobium sp.]